MRFGICILPDLDWRRSRPLWQRAEQMGFDHAWTYDHVVWGGLPDSRWFSCMPILTAASTVTSTIGLGAFVVSPNFRHPVAFSREVQTLVDISDGRFLLGLGAGGTPDDRLLGQVELTARQKVDRLQEFSRLLDRTLRDDHVDAAGEYYTARDMRLVGGSVRDRVPLLMSGNGPRSVRFAASFGDGWITTGNTTSTTTEEWFAGIARNCEIVDAELANRPNGSGFARYLSIDSGPAQSMESIGMFDELTGRAAELGFTDVIMHWPRNTPPHVASEAVLDEVAASRLS